MSRFDKLVGSILYKEAAARIARFDNGLEIPLDDNNLPIDYEKFATYSPGSKSVPVPAEYGQSFRVYSPRGAGYEVWAYPTVKKYTLDWTE